MSYFDEHVHASGQLRERELVHNDVQFLFWLCGCQHIYDVDQSDR